MKRAIRAGRTMSVKKERHRHRTVSHTVTAQTHTRVGGKGRLGT